MMAVLYVNHRYGGYRLRILPEYLDERFLELCCRLTSGGNKDAIRINSSKHAQVFQFNFGGQNYFHKTFLPRTCTESIKEIFKGTRADRALKGHLLLNSRGFLAPCVIMVGRKGVRNFMVTRGVPDPINLETLFQSLSKPDSQSRINSKISVIVDLGHLIGRLHALGITHGDLRWGNLLLAKTDSGRIHYNFIDNERTVQYFRLRNQRRLKNLVQMNMFSDISITRTDRLRFFHAYLQENPNLQSRKKEWIRKVISKTKKRLDKKHSIKKSLKKCLRTNKRHMRTVKYDHYTVARRDFFEKVDFTGFLQNIDELMQDGRILKDGNKCFVSRVSLAGREVVVKRYNCKGIIHSVRHTIKRSRARRNWLHAHRLRMLNIPTAKPLAFIEKRRLLIIYKSYFITEYIDGQKLSDFLQDNSLLEKQRLSMVKKVTELLNKLSEHRITHGDLKPSNILIVDNKPMLIDLDSMTVHHSDWMFNIKRSKDLICVESRIGRNVHDSNA